MTPIQQMMLGLGGASDGDMVDDVFNVNLYTGDGSTTQAKDVGIDLSGEGGLVWVKRRDSSADHILVDTIRGYNKTLSTNTSGDYNTDSNSVKAFSSTGFTVGSSHSVGGSGMSYSSWTFRKTPGFFDVVEYTGDDNSGRTISHSLGSTPGMIIIKCSSNASHNWVVGHRGLSSWNNFMTLNSSGAVGNSAGIFNDTAPTSSVFTVGDSDKTNESGKTYIAYLFAHDDGKFGTGGDNPIVYCGSYTGNGSASGQHLDIGFEPQFFIQKNTAGSGGTWNMFDYVRGVVTAGGGVGDDRYFRANTDQTDGSFDTMAFTSTGVQINTDHGNWNQNGTEYIYLAIRRSDGKVGKAYTDATKVFAMATGNSSSTIPNFTSNFPVDMALIKPPGEAGNWWLAGRLVQGNELQVSGATDAQITWSYSVFDSMSGWQNYNGHDSSDQSWMWRRYRGGFDMITYTGDSSGSVRAISHNLGAEPDMMWFKCRNAGGTEWKVYHRDLGPSTIPRLNNALAAETSQTIFNNTDPSDTQFFVKGGSTNSSSETYVAMLFGSVSGISKCGSYTGTAGQLQITGVGFSPRLLLVKRTDGTGNWCVFDTTRGFGGGDDKKLFLNTNAAQTTQDVGNPTADGFELYSGNDDFNNTGLSYIYYAHA